MEKSKKYALYITIGLFVVTLISTGVLGYMWGTSRAENKSLREEKKAYKRGIVERDSIIELKEKRVVLLQDSFTRLVKDAVAENVRADSRLTVIKEDEDEMRKEVDDVHSLSDDSLTRLFNRLADGYEPPR